MSKSFFMETSVSSLSIPQRKTVPNCAALLSLSTSPKEQMATTKKGSTRPCPLPFFSRGVHVQSIYDHTGGLYNFFNWNLTARIPLPPRRPPILPPHCDALQMEIRAPVHDLGKPDKMHPQSRR